MKWDVDRALEAVSAETKALDGLRKEILANRAEGSRRAGFVIAGGFVVGVIGMMASGNVMGLLAGVVVALVGCAIVHQIYFRKGEERYRLMFKVGFLSKLVKAVEPEMTYVPESGITKSMFTGSGLFGKGADRYASEDLIHGKIGATKVMFSEVHSEEKYTTTDSKGNTRTHWRTIFKGVFFVADFHKEFRSPVTVMPDVAEKNFGWLGKKMQRLGGNLQRMEDPEFEKHFVVRGADAVEVRYLLTPSMQERLLKLRGRLGRDLRIGFQDSHVCLAIPNASNWFEGDLKMPAGDQSQTMMLMGQLKSCFQIVEELDLNTRIWTKV